MPEDRFILLVEGQRPIFQTKLRYHLSEPFKSAAKYAAEHPVDVPETDFVVTLPVPALAMGDNQPSNLDAKGGEAPAPPDMETNTEKAETAAKKVARSIRTRPRSSAVKKANSALTSSEGASAGDRRVQVEQKLVPTGNRLKAAIAASLSTASDMPLPRRKNIQEILAQTIPDPAEIGLE